MRKLDAEWEKAASGQSTSGRRVLTQDRDNPGRYLVIVFFDSYESAMENSNNPVTQEFAEKMTALADGPPTFFNLDVIDDTA
jgi:hypothetical protein